MTEVERLRDRVEELERLLGLHEAFPRPWRLTKQQSQTFGLLLRRPTVSRDQFIEALHGGESARCERLFDVIVSRLRLKLGPLGIEIKAEHGVGYFIPPASKRLARALIGAYEGEYNGRDDFAKSLEVGYAAIRERMAAGGPGWEPK